MSIGSIIKKLRRERDITQEELAEFLGISSQAVSQWECDKTAPDVSQLPLLAYIFGVTTDEILGVDIHRNEEKISEIIKEADKYSSAGEFEKSAEILSDALKAYPKSYRIMGKLADSLGSIKERIGDAIPLCERIIAECTDDELRYSAYQTVIYAYRNSGNREKAVEYAKRMPPVWISREDMLMHILAYSKESKDNLIEYIKFFTGRIIMCLDGLAMEDGYSPEDQLALYKQTVDILETIYCDGDYNYSANYMADAYMLMGEVYAGLKDKENLLLSLENELKYRLMFDSYDKEAVNTSPAVRGYCDGGWICSIDGTTPSAAMLNLLNESENYDFVREEPRFKEIISKLEAEACLKK